VPVEQARFASDGAGGGGMVAGEHDDAYSRVATAAHGSGDGRLERIVDADEA
jgi:hypothetical protein